MYLLGTAIGYIILTPLPKISVGCGPAAFHMPDWKFSEGGS